MSTRVVLIFASVVAISGAALVKDSKDLCSLKDKEFNKCLARNIQASIPYLSKGIPKYNVTINPLRVDQFDLSPSQGKTIQVVLKCQNVDFVGFQTAVIKRAKFDRRKVELDVDFETKDPLRLSGVYTATGKILTLPLNGEGKFLIILEKFKCNIVIKGHEEKRSGKPYFKTDNINLKISTSRLRLDFKDLFKGNKQISEELNRTLNENWDAVWQDVRKSVEVSMGKALVGEVNKILTKTTVDELFRA